MARGGLFAEWQPQYAAHGVATFPVKGKKPSVRGHQKVGPKVSAELAQKYGDAGAFGFALAPAKVVALDIDTPDENVLAEALDRHGATPLVVRSGSGNFQAWYRRQDEGRLIRPDPSRPIDILGRGFVVAPPSMGARGQYQIIQGELSDIAHLPFLMNGPARSKRADAEAVGVGSRNNTLWRQCMEQARYCDDRNALLDVARTLNANFAPPLLDDEVTKVTTSAWGHTERGENWFGRQIVAVPHDEIDGLLHEDPDAFILLTVLRRHHWGRDFVVANAMAEHMPKEGWTRKRLSAARERLELSGLIEMVRQAGRGTGPARYRLKGGQN